MAKKRTPTFSLKDQLFSREKVRFLADLLEPNVRGMDVQAFVRSAMRRFPDLELKERIVHLAVAMEDCLDKDYRVAASQIEASLPPKLDPTLSDDDFGDFIIAPFGEYVARNGMRKQHLALSLRTLKSITQRFSMEDAIRRFLNEYPEETLRTLEKWATDDNYHVRRLVSEGTRPLLPWSGRLAIDPLTPLPFLDQLHRDPTRYVTRSVANHLNDIAKKNPNVVVERLREWRKLGKQSESELDWISRHALRTLVKQGNRRALALLGFRWNPKIEVGEMKLDRSSLLPGHTLLFSIELRALREEPLLVDYVIDFVKANGKTTPKVHKLKQLNLSKGESVLLEKRHVFKANATTYTLYPGTHRITMQINGRPYGSAEFEILPP